MPSVSGLAPSGRRSTLERVQRPCRAWPVAGSVPKEVSRMSGTTATRTELDLMTALGTVGESMTRTVVTVTPDMTAGEALGLLRRKGVGGAPVVRDGRVVGIVTVSDLAGPHH